MFAQGGSGARSREWITLGNNTELTALDTALPLNEVRGADTVFGIMILPASVAQGSVVTIQRIVGQLHIAWLATGLLNANVISDAITPLTMSIQLVPLKSGLFSTQMFLSPRNTADLESPRFMWWRRYSGGRTNSLASRNNVNGAFSASANYYHSPDYVMDIKVARRFDLSLWGLALVGAVETSQFELDRWAVDFAFRGLLLSAGGLG